jgi:predicted Zn-dependent protease
MKKLVDLSKLLILLLFLLTACKKNAVTGRKQIALFPENVLQQQSLSLYRSFLISNKVIVPSGTNDAQMVNRVGKKISIAITEFYASKGLSKELEGYNWEFNLVNNNEANAWCMPGGKVVVYTGLLPYTKDENALAVVLGHEITHAVAHHGNERLSQALIAQGFQVSGNIFMQNNQKANAIFNSVFTPGANMAYLLPNSRKQEYEADRFGLIFAAIAGYDPRSAIDFWTRMNQAYANKTPEFLATHPSNEKRIKKLNEGMDEALIYYKK